MFIATQSIALSVKQFQKQQRFLFTLCVLMCIIIFSYDIALPLGYAGGVPYVAVILAALRLKGYQYTFWFAIVCSGLTVLGYFLSPAGGEWGVVLLNRALALFVIWVTAILGVLQKRSQAEIVESEVRFKLMADTAPLLIWQSDTDDRWEFLSEGWFDYLDRKTDYSPRNYLKQIHKNDRQPFLNIYQRATRLQSPFQVEVRLRSLKDGNYHWMFVHGAPVINKEGEFSGYIGSCMNISTRKKTEKQLEQTRNMVAHQDKMSSIGEMAAGILHEVGNPIAAIQGLAHAAVQETESKSVSNDLKDYLNAIVKQTERISNLTEEVSELASPVEVEKQLINVNDVVDRTVKLMRFDKKFRGIRFELDLDSRIPAVYGSKDHLNQILINLISNAGDASEFNQDEKAISIKTHSKPFKVLIDVEDNGTGMDADTLRRAQDPFFTTKPAGKGTGLGLSLCNTLMNKFHGGLQVVSKPGEGTCITLSIPAESNL